MNRRFNGVQSNLDDFAGEVEKNILFHFFSSAPEKQCIVYVPFIIICISEQLEDLTDERSNDGVCSRATLFSLLQTLEIALKKTEGGVTVDRRSPED